MAAADPGRPWWASGGEADGLRDEDPLEVFRRARAGERAPEGDPEAPGPAGHDRAGTDGGDPDRDAPGADGAGAGDAGRRPWWSEPLEQLAHLMRDLGRTAASAGEASRDRSTANARPGTGDGHVHTGSVEACRACPVCAGLRALTEARPEVVGHVSEAVRHLTLAGRAFLDAQAEGLRADEGLQHIRLDEE